MKKKLIELYKHPFIRGGSIMLFGTIGIHLSNYLYHLIMGRMLGPSDYGILASLIGVFYLLNVINQTVNLVIVKFVSHFYGEKDTDKIRALYHKLKFIIFSGGISIAAILFFATPFISGFLHLEYPRFLFEILIAFAISFIANFYRSFLQGLVRFAQFTINLSAEMIVKLVLAVVLVAFGFGIDGAIIPLIVGALAGVLLGVWRLKDIIGEKHKLKKIPIALKELLAFSLPSIALTLSFASLFTTDIILVRHYFSGIQSGFYASIAVLGKIIFYASSPLVMTMYPLVAKAKSEKTKYSHFFFITLGIVLLISTILTVLYFVFPHVIVNLLFGSKYQEVSSLLGLMGVFLTLYSITFAAANYFLSLGKVRTTLFPLIAGVAQIIGIVIFHTNLLQVIYVSIVITLTLALVFLIYYILYAKRE